ncbi:MAG TPA: peptidoglycan DD-metalloendopeptidase family protein [Rhizomicrobium sp.]|jgi:septal ring factor EnvC (AmiA/AmiB activator)
MFRAFLVFALLASASALAKAPVHKPPVAKPVVHKAVVHKPAAPQPDPDADIPLVKDLSGAIPANQAAKLPSTSEQYKTLKTQIAKTKPQVDSAKQKSDALKAEADALRTKLIATAARVQFLEEEKGRIDVEVVRLGAEEQTLASDFARDRVRVARLLAVMQRLQQDMPPALAMRPDDALGAARASMVLGASLPHVYGAAADLARKLDRLRKTRADLIVRRAESARDAIQLSSARQELDQLLAMKSREADAAAAQYGDLSAKLDAAADQAANLQSLLIKVAALRAGPPGAGITVVTATNGGGPGFAGRGTLIRPVIGQVVAGGGEDGTRSPGLSYVTQAAAQVVAPADARVLFAGRYHKEGQVLILDMGDGYALVLAGLDRVDVRPGDQLLAGEPVGAMPQLNGSRLYFEVRDNGKGISPAPWLGNVKNGKAKKT